MMRNFEFPENLPEELAPLAHMNGVSANMEYFDAVVEKIANQRLVCRPDTDADEASRRVEELKKQASQGSADAKNELGILLEKGTVTLVQNLKKARMYYEQAKEGGCLAAEYNLGDIYEICSKDLTMVNEYGLVLGEYESPEDLKLMLRQKADACYAHAAEMGYAPALYKVGNRREEERQLEEAYFYYEQAAQQKYLPAVNALGWMCRNGLGTEADVEKAEELYQEAAEAGYPPAIYNYAKMLEVREPERAMNLYQQVAYGEHALPMAAYALGRRYEYGLRDLRNAISCYERAYAGGIIQAGEDLARCRNTLF